MREMLLAAMALLLLIPNVLQAEQPAGNLPPALQLAGDVADDAAKESANSQSPAGCENCNCAELTKRIEAMERHAWATHDWLKETHITEDRVREIVKEELAAVLGVKLRSGEVEKRNVSVKPTGTTEIQLEPGEQLVSIDGVPVRTNTYTDSTSAKQVVRYTSPAYEARSFGTTGFFVRPRGLMNRFSQGQQSCYVDASGNRVCN